MSGNRFVPDTGIAGVKILILKPSSLGDVIQALPVLRLLKAHWPQSEIYWWIESGLAPLLEDDPDLAGVLYFQRKRWAAPQNWIHLVRTVLWMRRHQFDWVLDLQCLARSAVIAWLANGKSLVGLDETREGARGFYDRIVARPSFLTHAVDWYLEVLRLLDVPTDRPFEWLPVRTSVAASIRQRWDVGQGTWVALQPGARWGNKRWPVESFARLVGQMAQRRPELRFAILGGSEDRLLGQTIAQAAPAYCLDLTAQLSLPEMVEWIRLCDVFLSNDTGPMHVAAALGRPVLALFGPTEPRRTGPYGQIDHVLQLELPCVPCLKPRCRFVRPLECLRALSPEVVLAALERRLLDATSRRASLAQRLIPVGAQASTAALASTPA